MQIQFSEEKFKEIFARLSNWSEKEKINCVSIWSTKNYLESRL
jgi:hypothetical protein